MEIRGQRLEAVEMQIGQAAQYKKTFTQEDFNRFAALTGDDNPIHVDPQFSARTKFGKTVAHGMLLYSTIVQSLGALLPGPGTVQINQEVMFPNPTFVGQEVTVQLEVKALPSPDMAIIATSIIQDEGMMSCIGRTHVWVPGTKIDFSGVAFEAPIYVSEAQEHRGLCIGQVAEKNRVFMRDDLVEFLLLLDETNPIFTDGNYARARGFRDAPLPGGLLGGIVSELLGTQLPGRGTNWLKQSFFYLSPVYPDEEITARVEVIRLRPGKDLANLRTTLTNQDDVVVVDGEALVWVSDVEKSNGKSNA